MFEQVTKFQGRPRTADELPATVSEAIRAMLTGRNRPGLRRAADRPAGQAAERARPTSDAGRARRRPRNPIPREVEEVARLLSQAKRPLIIAGTGVIRALGERGADAARGAAPGAGHRDDVGRRRHPGRPPALRRATSSPRHQAMLDILNEADLVLVAGSRLDAQTSGPLAHAAAEPRPPRRRPDDHQPDLSRRRRASSRTRSPGLAALADAVTPRRDRATTAGARRAPGPCPRRSSTSLAPDRGPIYGFFRDLRAAMPRETITVHDAATINGWSGWFWPTYVPEGNIWP